MNKTDLETIESKLKIKLPESYKRVVLNYPKELDEFAEKYEDSDSVYEFFAKDPEGVIAGNFHLTSPKPERFDHVQAFGSTRFFVVGGDGCGNDWCIDLDKDDPPVLFYDHEDDEFTEFAPSMDEFAAMLIEEYDEVFAESDEDD